MPSIIVFVIRIIIVLIMVRSVLPVMLKEYRSKKDDLSKLRLYLLILGVVYTLAGLLPIFLHICAWSQMCHSQVFSVSDSITLLNSVSLLAGAVMLRAIYTRKY